MAIVKWFVGGLVLFVILSNAWVVLSTAHLITEQPEELQNYEVALVFGTSRYIVGGGENLFFQNRIRAAGILYKKGLVKHFILSGDNNTKYYNEPAQMKDAILASGVPEQHVTLDYAGFRTLDTVVRGKEVFGQEKLILITQRFHGYRALFIAKFHGIDAICYPAKSPKHSGATKVWIRELFARPKAVIDLYLLRKSPKFLGEKEKIEF